MEGGILVGVPPDPPKPVDWHFNGSFSTNKITTVTVGRGRKQCDNCRVEEVDCKVWASEPNNACEKCLARGLDCTGDGDRFFPISDLARVGFGNAAVLHSCAECIQHNRNCDRQRPCDSCREHNGSCDVILTKARARQQKSNSKKQGSDHRAQGCLKDAFSKPPGPLYYLALGYGAQGVNDVKDGSRLEHWIGPLIPSFEMAGLPEQSRNAVANAAIKARHSLLPDGAPPHGYPGGALEATRPSDLTTENLVDMLRAQWPGIKPPNERPFYSRALNEAKEYRDEARHQMRKRGQRKQVESNSTTSAPEKCDGKDKSRTLQVHHDSMGSIDGEDAGTSEPLDDDGDAPGFGRTTSTDRAHGTTSITSARNGFVADASKTQQSHIDVGFQDYVVSLGDLRRSLFVDAPATNEDIGSRREATSLVNLSVQFPPIDNTEQMPNTTRGPRSWDRIAVDLQNVSHDMYFSENKLQAPPLPPPLSKKTNSADHLFPQITDLITLTIRARRPGTIWRLRRSSQV